MRQVILADVDAVARRAAAVIAEAAREALTERGRFLVATSGGSTPWLMLRFLANLDLPWARVELFQVDERIAPAGHADRNLTSLKRSLLDQLPESRGTIHAMPVEMNGTDQMALDYSHTLALIAGNLPVCDLVHLGLGEDGHTACLVPYDPVLDESTATFAVAGVYAGRRRLTLTYPVLDHARRILRVVTGAAKAMMLRRLERGDGTIPAGRVRSDHALLLADRAASPDSNT
ncbi:MAG: 6-phosphogluconolactonase [Phycisphaerae bacterium]|nr:6-phosphogluconolactonase [Phycisphaerae bacterium]